MKLKFPILILLLIIQSKLFSQEIPTRSQVLLKMKLANEYFMNKWADPTKELVNEKVRPSNIWTRATYYEGLMALYQITKDQKYLDYTLSWAEFHQWNLAYGKFSRNADNYCCGQTYLDLYRMDPKPERIKTIKEAIDEIVSAEKSDDWTWIDALQMAMPVFARFGAITGEQKYWDKMYDMYLHTKKKQGGGLYNPHDGLWWRDSIYVHPYKEPNGEDCYWSRGNGWVLAAMVRTLEQNPPEKRHRKEYLKMFKSMSEALSKVQREDGFWNVSLHDPNNFGGPETSGTAFFVYGMAWGINHQYLDKNRYFPIVMKGWNAISEKALHPDGFLGFVQGTGKEPASSQPTGYDVVPNFEDFALGAFLLAGSEVYKLAK